MLFEDAMKKTGGHSVGGQLVVNTPEGNVLVGKYHDGMLIVEDTDAARAQLSDAAEPAKRTPRKARADVAQMNAVVDETVDEPVHHAVAVDDEIVTQEIMGG